MGCVRFDVKAGGEVESNDISFYYTSSGSDRTWIFTTFFIKYRKKGGGIPTTLKHIVSEHAPSGKAGISNLKFEI
jgi:hypothetical protein